MAIAAARRDVQKDLQSVEFETSEDVDVTSTFDEIGLCKSIHSFNAQLVKGNDMACKRCEISSFIKDNGIDLFFCD